MILLAIFAAWLFAVIAICWVFHLAGEHPDNLTVEDYDVLWPEGWAFCAEGHDGRCCVHSVRYKHREPA